MIQVPSKETLRRAAQAIEVIGVVTILLIAFVAARDFAGLGGLARLEVEAINPISVGHLSVSVIIAACAGLTEFRGARFNYWSLTARILAIALATAIALASVSRGPLLSLMVVVLMMLVSPATGARPLLSKIASRTSLLVLGGIGVVVAIYAIEDFAAISIVRRIAETVGDDATNERIVLIRAALDQFASHPFLGNASVEIESGLYPHNLFIESLMIGGIPTTLLLCLFVAVSVRAAFQLWKRTSGGRWVALLFVQYLLGIMFSSSVLLDGRFWGLALATLAVAAQTTSGGERLNPGSRVNRVAPA